MKTRGNAATLSIIFFYFYGTNRIFQLAQKIKIIKENFDQILYPYHYHLAFLLKLYTTTDFYYYKNVSSKLNFKNNLFLSFFFLHSQF